MRTPPIKQLLITALPAAAILVAAWFFDPTDASGFWPRCPIKWATGFDCPGCGSSRALHALVHGHPLQALRFNPWLPLAALYCILAVAADLHKAPLLYRLTHHPLAIIAFLLLTATWTVFRNG